MNIAGIRTRWAAVGAAVAVTLGAGGIGLVSATNPAGAVAYVPLDEPCRAGDTRPGLDNVGPKSTPIGEAETHTVNSNHGDCNGVVPGSATGLQLNITSVNATAGSFLTIWPEGDRPFGSSLNPTPGQPPIPNAVTTGITNAGDFNIYNNAGTVDVIVDVVGYYTDHDHDDRYYTKAQVDAQRPRMLLPDAQINDFFQFEFTAESSLSSNSEQSVTTDVPGYLQLSVYARADVSCSASDDNIVFITIDGDAVKSSAYLFRTDDPFDVMLSGITDLPVAAGEHEIGVGIECSGASLAGSVTTTLFRVSSGVLFPS